MKLFKLFVFFAIVILLFGIFVLSVYMGFFGVLPNREKLASISNEEASLVYSSDDVIIGKYFDRNRTNIRWEDVPVHLRNALIATEDRRFFEHKGFDTKSYFRVFIKSLLLQDNSGGGSTLTQQLVKNLYGRKDFGFLTLPVNKLKEIIIASRLEKIYNKEELLLLYLNSVPFGEDVYGVESASRRFFSKPARKLKVEESAVLIGMLKANTYYNPMLHPDNSKQRRNLVLSLMVKEKYLTAEKADSLKKLPLKLNYEDVNAAPAGYFVQQVKKKAEALLDSINDNNDTEYNLEKDGLRIYTTLNMRMQQYALNAAKNHLAAMQKLLDKELENRRYKKSWLTRQKQFTENDEENNTKRKVRLFDWEGIKTKNITRLDSLWYYYKMLHASVLVTSPKNGEVLVWVGGNNFHMLPFDMVLSHRQIASAFKPVLYATALEKEMEPCMYLENTKVKYDGYEDWEPENYDMESTSDSTVAMWYALTHSMNLPSVDLYFKVGRENLLNTCDRLEFPRFRGDAPSIALGTLDVSLYEAVRAYGAFANEGRMVEPFMIRKITDARGKVLYKAKSADPVQVFDAKTSETITAILQQVVNQGTGAGIRSRFGIQSELAGKTGTAQNYTDAWFIAYTPDIVVGTWVGASKPDIHFFSGNGTGSALAMPVAAGILRNIESNPGLRSKYLTPFTLSQEAYAFLECDPYHETGLKGFFNRLFSSKPNEETDTIRSKPAKEKERPKDIRSLIRKIFKGQ